MAIKHLSGKRLQGTEAERIALNITPPPSTSWKILGRTAVTSGTDIDVTVTAKDNMMVLANIVASGNIDQGMHFNDDGGSGGSSNYAWRIRRDGAVTGQGINTYRLNTEETYFVNAFQIYKLQHTNGQEKIVQWNSVQANATGAAAIPVRNEGVGKWVTTGNITKVSFTNIDSGSYASGSEVVVLGCNNNESDSGTNFWQQLGSEVIAADGDSFDLSFTAKKYLWVQLFNVDSATGDMTMKFNNDSGGNYSERYSDDGGADSTNGSKAGIDGNYGALSGNTLANYFISNNTSQEKLVSYDYAIANTAGAGNAPQRMEAAGKWANTSAQINRITITAGGGNFDVGSYLRVWGSD